MKLRYTPPAIADLQEIQSYISNALHNPAAANRIIKLILENCAHLKLHPALGMSLSEKTGENTDLRYLLCGQYLALYRIEDDFISVARILSGRTDYMRILFDQEPEKHNIQN